MAVEPPRTILGGRYEVTSLLGRGGMADVLAAHDRMLDRPVAVKRLKEEVADNRAAVIRFRAEAQAAAGLTHPNVVAVYNAGIDNDVPYLVMERLPGRTLSDLLQDGPLPPEQAARIVLDVLAGLGHAHRRLVIHRDIKPGNVLLADDGAAKLADFGIAKSAATVDLTRTNEVMGTPAYLAPERVAGSPASAASDLYAVGVLLYELLVGDRPFQRDTPLAVLHAIVSGDVQPLGQRRPELSADLVAIVERAMHRDPLQRFASAESMGAALAAASGLDELHEFEERALEGGAVTSADTAATPAVTSEATSAVASPTKPTPPPLSSGPDTSGHDRSSRRAKRRSRREAARSRQPAHRRRGSMLPSLTAIVTLLAIAAAGSLLLIGDDGDPSPPAFFTPPVEAVAETPER